MIEWDNARDRFEKENVRNFVRLFPVADKDRMNELIKISRLSFETFHSKTNETLFWSKKYSFVSNEDELFHQMSRSRRRPTSTDEPSRRKPVATQTPSDIRRLKSSPQRKSTGDVSRPNVSANPIVRREFYKDRQTNEYERRRSSSPKSHRATKISPKEKT